MMRPKSFPIDAGLLALIVVVGWALLPCASSAGPVRIKLDDGTSVETSSYWRKGDEIRFTIPNGEAGFPEDRVVAIEEIISAQEFDPQVFLGSSVNTADKGKADPFQEEVGKKVISKMENYKAMNPDEASEVLSTLESSGEGGNRAPMPEPVYSPLLDQRQPFARLGRIQGQGDQLLVINPIVLQGKIEDRSFWITFYDADGNVIGQEECRIYEVDMKDPEKRRLGITGNVYSLVASVDADPRIKRYEITLPAGQ